MTRDETLEEDKGVYCPCGKTIYKMDDLCLRCDLDEYERLLIKTWLEDDNDS